MSNDAKKQQLLDLAKKGAARPLAEMLKTYPIQRSTSSDHRRCCIRSMEGTP